MVLNQTARQSVGMTVQAFKSNQGKSAGSYCLSLDREDYVKLGEWFDENDHVKIAINPVSVTGICGENSTRAGEKFEMISVSFTPWDKAKIDAWKLSIAAKKV